MQITDDLLLYMKLVPVAEWAGKVCGVLGVVLGVVMLFYYPHQWIWKKRFMQRIEINTLEVTRISESTKASGGVEESSLLMGLTYTGAKEDVRIPC